jgi:competence protein ComEA
MDAAKERVTILFLSFVSRKWRKILIPITAIAVVTALLLFPRGQSDNGIIITSAQNPFTDLIKENELDVETPEVIPVAPIVIVIDVKGAVRYPGVYSLQEGDRLIDAINAAGGYLPNADSRMLNHAMKLADEFLVYVPIEGEVPLDGELNLLIGNSSNQDDGKVNINTANVEELITIPGIGPAKAAAIIQHRNTNGAFKTPESLMDISGIGLKTYEKLEQLIKVK